MAVSRRQFLARLAAVPSVLALGRDGSGEVRTPTARAVSRPGELGFPDPTRQWRGDSSVTAALRSGERSAIGRPPALLARPFDWEGAGALLQQRFRDLRRHFIFEYYPWYGVNPWRHWNEARRVPPVDIASNYMPLLGPYDSTDPAVLERHARWIAESGVGAVNISWWGPGSDTDRAVPLIMDVMREHDVHVTFHLEPYADQRSRFYARDILYLLQQYGEKRRWDCFLLLEDAGGKSGPVFKSFGTILPSTVSDCHGVVHPVPGYTPDSEWRRATDTVREELRQDFDRLTLLADSLDFGRTPASGFDGIAIYDNYVEPPGWRSHATECGRRGLVFSFNVNPGFDAVEERQVPPDSCYRPPRLVPADDWVAWDSSLGRVRAARLSAARIAESLQSTVALQTDPALRNSEAGFFLTYINSFNEWHEGHQFEPMKSLVDLRIQERAVGYHNAVLGGYRLEVLRGYLGKLLG